MGRGFPARVHGLFSLPFGGLLVGRCLATLFLQRARPPVVRSSEARPRRLGPYNEGLNRSFITTICTPTLSFCSLRSKEGFSY